LVAAGASFALTGEAGARQQLYLHAKSGSLSPLKHFAYDMRQIIRRQRLPGRAVRLQRRDPKLLGRCRAWQLASRISRVPKLPCARNGVDPHVETIRPSKSIPKMLPNAGAR